MEEIEVPPQAEAILLQLSDHSDPIGAHEIRVFYQAKAQTGNKLVSQTDGYQIKYDQNEDKFHIVT